MDDLKENVTNTVIRYQKRPPYTKQSCKQHTAYVPVA
jgi:hypothetical protein